MRYFTSYLKKVILLHNLHYLECITPNIASKKLWVTKDTGLIGYRVKVGCIVNVIMIMS